MYFLADLRMFWPGTRSPRSSGTDYYLRDMNMGFPLVVPVTEDREPGIRLVS